MSTRWLSDQINSHIRTATLQQLRKAGKLAIIFTYSSPSNSSSAIVLLEFSSLNQNTTDSLRIPNHHETDNLTQPISMICGHNHHPPPRIIYHHGLLYETTTDYKVHPQLSPLLYLAAQSNYNLHYHCRQCIFRRERNVPTSNVFHSSSKQVEHR